jgi:hypothetical protein
VQIKSNQIRILLTLLYFAANIFTLVRAAKFRWRAISGGEAAMVRGAGTEIRILQSPLRRICDGPISSCSLICVAAHTTPKTVDIREPAILSYESRTGPAFLWGCDCKSLQDGGLIHERRTRHTLSSSRHAVGSQRMTSQQYAGRRESGRKKVRSSMRGSPELLTGDLG